MQDAGLIISLTIMACSLLLCAIGVLATTVYIASTLHKFLKHLNKGKHTK